MNNKNQTLHRMSRYGILSLILLVAVSGQIYDEIEVAGIAHTSLITWLAGFFVVSEFVWLYLDFVRHRQPLRAVDPDVDYTFFHHINQVTLPTLRYRATSIFHK